MSEPLWRFSDSVSEERQSKLFGISRFDQVVDHVASSCKIKYYTEERAEAVRLADYSRASFLLGEEDGSTYDAFFNSPVGYRAQYCSSSNAGEAANRQLIQRLKEELLRFASTRVTGFDIKMVSTSLDGEQAKIWILEDVATIPRPSLRIEVLHRPWMEAAMNSGKDDPPWRGVLAPTGRYLEVKGGWLDKNGRQFIDETKLDRSQKIQLYGYAG